MIPEMMNAVIARQPGGPEVLEQVQRAVPQPSAGEVLIRVANAGVNRPDIMQRNGMPLPPHHRCAGAGGLRHRCGAGCGR